jgi:hypothetical protein
MLQRLPNLGRGVIEPDNRSENGRPIGSLRGLRGTWSHEDLVIRRAGRGLPHRWIRAPLCAGSIRRFTYDSRNLSRVGGGGFGVRQPHGSRIHG